MMTVSDDMVTGFVRLMEGVVKQRVQEELDQIADAACADLRKKIMAQADALALSVMAHYEVQRMGPNLTITVKKVVET